MHTPGPWELDESNTSDLYSARITENYKIGDYRGCICSLQDCRHIHGIGMDECRANARLISAAPYLLEALKSIAANSCCSKCQEAALVAKKAIAKAEGGE